MGQKVNPIGFRLAVTKDWRSKWYAPEKEYADSLHSDLAIRAYLKEKLMQDAISKIVIERGIQGREFECAALGNEHPAASVPCEILPSREFYDYEDKYELNLARTELPPNLAPSEIAEMRNTGERYGGALNAGLFMPEFVGDTPWVHVDIAGTAAADKEGGHVAKGGTGFAVSTIIEYLAGRE